MKKFISLIIVLLSTNWVSSIKALTVIPITGDDSPVTIIIIVMAVAAVCGIAVLFLSKRKKK